ncbi:hypothetical protein RchiOBHm_Chr2g0122341 [Rosa chinensis]|uniref:Uncharacterized protein n=1 Tax=Rosa chinensis TaxID=74649 RepID=A0A2P6RSU0_ROSCH|nr:hypothetical protein RchiOBHm_Chr2g0122341 [Rosa chinensis]
MLLVGPIVGLDQYVNYFKIQLRIQQRIKSAELRMLTEEQENELPNFTPFIQLMSPLL